MTTRKFIQKVHLWLSIPTGIIIAIICITGAILTFETELLELYYPERYYVKEVKESKIPLDKLIPIVNKQLDNNSVSSIKVTSDPDRTYTATLAEGFRISAFVDPYTGEVKGTHVFRESFFFKMMSLHRWLMDGTRTWGKYTVGVTTVLFVFILISGIVWWIPNKRKNLKNRLTIKTKNGPKRLLYDLHLVLGIYACLFLLICSLTGLMWSFEWYRQGISKIFGAEAPEGGRGHHGGGDKKKKEIDTQNWDIALKNLQARIPDNKYITIDNGSATVLTKNAPHLRATDKYKWDSSTGEIGKASLFGEKTTSATIMSWAYAIHVGAYGGIFTRILTCLACIIGTTLPLTGYYLFYRKHIAKSSKRKK